MHSVLRRLLEFRLPRKSCVRLFTSRNFLKLKDRGIFTEVLPCDDESVSKLISSNSQTVYCGFDPTAPGLHIGNLLCLIGLLHCQRAGHSPIVVIGSASALLGDPTDLDEARTRLHDDEIIQNTLKVERNVRDVFENHQKYFWKSNETLPPLRICNNIKWYENINVIHFLCEYGRHVRVGNLMSRKSVKNRIESNVGISFMELSYQIIQAYDWHHLHKNYNCNFQIGGNDQQGNIKTGIEFLKSISKHEVYGVCLPLVKTAKGSKIGKTSGNAVWIDEDLFSAYELYQYFRNIPDSAVEEYLRLFTFIPLQEIERIMKAHTKDVEKSSAQIILAKNVVRLVHGEAGLETALTCTEALFNSNVDALARLDEKMMEKLFKNVPNFEFAFDPGFTVLKLLMETKCFYREEDAIRIIRSGGVLLNHRRILNPQAVLILGDHILPNMYTLIRIEIRFIDYDDTYFDVVENLRGNVIFAEPGKVIDSEEIEAFLNESGIKLIYIHALWHSASRISFRDIFRMSADIKIPFMALSSDTNPKIIEEFNVRYVPCFIWLFNRIKVDELIGVHESLVLERCQEYMSYMED